MSLNVYVTVADSNEDCKLIYEKKMIRACSQ